VLNIIVVFIRCILLVTVVFVTMRLMGKRQIGQLQPYELVVAIMISELGSVPMQDVSIPILFGIIPIISLLAIQILISWLSLKSHKARRIICGTPKILIDAGIIQEHTLRRELYDLSDLMEQLRTQGWHDITNVHTAILETSGQLSIIPKSMFRPVDASMINAPSTGEGCANLVIMDGVIIAGNLERSGKTKKWLMEKIDSVGMGSIKDVLLANISPDSTLHLQFHDEKTATI